MAKTLTNEEISGMKQMFKQFDKDNSGTITINELQKGLEKKGARSTKTELEKMLKEMDVDGNGELDYENLHRRDAGPVEDAERGSHGARVLVLRQGQLRISRSTSSRRSSRTSA